MKQEDCKSKHGSANPEERQDMLPANRHNISLPPIVMDSNDTASINFVRRYLKRHSIVGNAPAAEEERRRLLPFFNSYSKRLLSPASDVINGAAQQATNDNELLQPESLSRLFMAAAKTNKNTILSGVMILPAKFIQNNIAVQDEPHMSIFESKTEYNSKSFNFGFLQVFSKDDQGQMSSSVGLPLLSLDKEYLDIIEPVGGRELLEALQAVTTYGNHDMLHHYTSQIINNDIAKKMAPTNDENIRSWYGQYIMKVSATANKPLEYESWAVQSHARTWKFLQDGPAGQEVRDSIDRFLDKLQDIAASLANDESISTYKKHAVIDYFGIAMALMMTRLMPLSDPGFDQYLGRLESIDPAPQNTIVNLLKGKEVMRTLCDHLGQQAGKENAGRIKLAEMMIKSGVDRKNLFYRTFFSLKLISGSSKDELVQIEDNEFMTLLKDELDSPYPDGVFLERLNWDIRDFVNRIFSYDLPDTHSELEQLAQDNLCFLLKVRRNRIVDSIHSAEGIHTKQDITSGTLVLSDYGFDTTLRKDYVSIKKLQISGMVPTIVYPQAVPDAGTRLEKAQEQLDRQDADMVRAIAKDMGFKP